MFFKYSYLFGSFLLFPVILRPQMIKPQTFLNKTFSYVHPNGVRQSTSQLGLLNNLHLCTINIRFVSSITHYYHSFDCKQFTTIRMPLIVWPKHFGILYPWNTPNFLSWLSNYHTHGFILVVTKFVKEVGILIFEFHFNGSKSNYTVIV